jgi:adenylosuccinate synthase
MITLVVGGQFGGEGKGKITAALASATAYDIVCRCGGVNSSHTVVNGAREIRFRMLPAAAAVDKRPLVIFGAGTLIHIPTFLREIELVGYDPRRICVDSKAGVVSEDCVTEQRSDPRYNEIGSTLTGTGYATAKRAQRSLRLARDFPELNPFMCDTVEVLHTAARRRQNILIEGHQGIGLSNYHGDYPFTSSRDCTAAEMFSELGLATRWPHRVVLVVKVFPTRNHPGTLYGEMSGADADALGVREFGGGSWGISDGVVDESACSIFVK